MQRQRSFSNRRQKESVCGEFFSVDETRPLFSTKLPASTNTTNNKNKKPANRKQNLESSWGPIPLGGSRPPGPPPVEGRDKGNEDGDTQEGVKGGDAEQWASAMARHLPQSELDYPFKLLQYINGFRVSKVIFSACELGVFDLLLRSSRPLTAGEVSQELGTNGHSMEQLLDMLVGLEILDVQLTQGTAFYSSTDVANQYLAKSGPKSLHDMIIYQSQTIYPLWGNMVDAVREGRNQNEKTFGLSSEDIFSAIYRSEEEMLKFMGLMNSTWVTDGHDVVTAFDLRRFTSVVDVGGCSGALARELAKAYPASTVTVLDMPKVVQMAQKHFCQSGDTLLFQEVDFFEEAVPPASLYILARILHDWKEEKCLRLLRKLHAACQPGGGVLLVEALLFENHRGPIIAQLFSLNMLLQTEGREHPPSHYTHMLTVAGFTDVQVCRTGKSYDAILALK